MGSVISTLVILTFMSLEVNFCPSRTMLLPGFRERIVTMSGPIQPSSQPGPVTSPKAQPDAGKVANGSDGVREIGAQSPTRKLGNLNNRSSGKSLRDRIISKTAPASSQGKAQNAGKKPTKVALQEATDQLKVPGFRQSKDQALIGSTQALRSMTKQLGNTGHDQVLKDRLEALLNTVVIKKPEPLTLSEASQPARTVNIVMSAPQRQAMEQNIASSLDQAKMAIWCHKGASRQEPIPAPPGPTQAYNRQPVTADGGYQPMDYTSKKIIDNEQKSDRKGVNGRYADSSDVASIKGWNNTYARSSHGGTIIFDDKMRPLNPTGATGVEGRGELGLWGPNHAADNIITRTNDQGEVEVLLIFRKRDKQWALPGGMVEGEKDILNVALKELAEEALATGGGSGRKDLSKTAIENKMQELKQFECFQKAANTFKGVVNDPRNTDNAWMETESWAVHLTPDVAGQINLQAGDDAADVKWMAVTEDNLNGLYASHSQIVRTAPVIQETLKHQQGLKQQQRPADGG